MVADFPRCDEQVERTSPAVADGVQLCVHATLGSTNQASTPPPFDAQTGRCSVGLQIAVNHAANRKSMGPETRADAQFSWVRLNLIKLIDQSTMNEENWLGLAGLLKNAAKLPKSKHK